MVKSITEKSRESQSPHQPSNLGQFRRLGETRTSYMTAVRRGYTLGTLSYTSSDRDSTVCEETDQGSSNAVLSVTSISNEAQSCTDSAWKSSFGSVKETTIKITENFKFHQYDMDRSTGDSGMESEDEVFPDPRRCTSLPANQRRKRAQRVQLLSADQKLASGSSTAEIKHTLPRLKENSCNCGRQVVHYNVEHLHLDVSREPLGIKIAQVVDFKYQPVLHMNGSGYTVLGSGDTCAPHEDWV
ncbi:uncharacterized protein [Apostichopus japonicus]